MNGSDRVVRWAPEAAFAALLLVAAAVLVWAGSGLTFFYDEWEVLLDREGFSAASVLTPHNGQVFVVPVLVYKALLALFGMTSQLPFRMTSVLVASLCGLLLFIHARRSVGGWMALAAVTPVLFLGAAWETLLLPLSLNFLVSLAAGLGMLLMLERGDRTGDISAALLLGLSIGAGGLGLAFAAGAAVDSLIRKDLPRLWIPALPLCFLGLWSLGYGGSAASMVTSSNVIHLPEYLFDAARSVVTSTTGISSGREPFAGMSARIGFDTSHGTATIVTLVLGLAILARVVLARTPVSRRALAIGAVLIAFWVLAGLATGAGREPQASRYQYPGAVLLIGFLLALLEGIGLPRLLPLFCLPLVVLSVGSNLDALDGGRDFLLEQTYITRSAIGALEAEGARDLPGLNLGEAAGGEKYLELILAGSYFRAVDEYGSPAFSRDQILEAPPVARQSASQVERTISGFRGPARDQS